MSTGLRSLGRGGAELDLDTLRGGIKAASLDTGAPISPGEAHDTSFQHSLDKHGQVKFSRRT